MLTLNGYSYPAEIIRVVDGDTINVRVTLADIDLGFGIHLNQTHDIKLRLAGINAPETSTKEGKTAADVLTKWLPVGGTCTVVTVKDRTEKYGRYLAWVYADLDVKDATDSPWVCVNDLLIAEGYAVFYNPSGIKKPDWDGLIHL